MKLAALLVLFAAASLSVESSAQENSARRCLEEMNRDVWLPFVQGVRGDDDKLYLGVRSKDYLRVASGDRFILGYCDGRSASDKGITRVLFTTKDGTVRTYFSRFQTISRKEGDAWRVLTDYFPPADGVGEEQFARAKAVDDLADFRCFMAYPDKKLRCDD